MTAGDVDRAALAGHTVVAIVPFADDVDGAVAATWTVARAAADLTDRVALVDLFVDRPRLDAGADQTMAEGIVDAFEFGASLNRVAQPQSPDGLYYIGAGTPTGRPDVVWSNPRWQRLANGFSSQGAMLLLSVPLEAIPHLSVRPDGVFAIADEDVDAHGLPALATWQEAGVPITRVSPGPWTADGQAVTPQRPPDMPRPTERPVSRAAQRSPHRRARRVAVVAAGLGGLLATWLLVGPGPRDAGAPTEVANPAAGETPPPPGDSLFYSVQVAAFNTAERALEHVARLGTAAATVTAIRLRNVLWHRVTVGALPDPQAADSLLRSLWERGLVEAGQGTILRTPRALDLGMRASVDLAEQEVQKLRDRGIPAYAIPASGGRGRILAGAFESPDQIAVTESLLTAAGLAATLATRTGTEP